MFVSRTAAQNEVSFFKSADQPNIGFLRRYGLAGLDSHVPVSGSVCFHGAFESELVYSSDPKTGKSTNERAILADMRECTKKPLPSAASLADALPSRARRRLWRTPSLPEHGGAFATRETSYRALPYAAYGSNMVNYPQMGDDFASPRPTLVNYIDLGDVFQKRFPCAK